MVRPGVAAVPKRVPLRMPAPRLLIAAVLGDAATLIAPSVAHYLGAGGGSLARKASRTCAHRVSACICDRLHLCTTNCTTSIRRTCRRVRVVRHFPMARPGVWL